MECPHCLHKAKSKDQACFLEASVVPIDLHLMAMLYKLHILPIYDYCDIVWSSCSNTLLQSLNRLLLKANKLFPNPSLFVSLTSHRNFHLCIMAFKILRHLSPPYLFNTLKFSISLSNRSLRNDNHLYLPFIRTEFGRGSFYYKVVLLWNSLNNELYYCKTLDNLKKLYKLINDL